MTRLVDLPFTNDNHLRLLLSLDRGHNVQRAVQQAVRAGDRVLDAGTGTGLLSFVALAAGAAEAVGFDRQSVETARAIAEKNGLASRLTFLQADLMDLDLPGVDRTRPFDVLLAFIYTNNPLVDEIRSQLVFDVRDRFCAPGCRVVPGAVRYRVTGCERTDWDLYTELADLDEAAATLRACYGFDFQPMIDVAKQELPLKLGRPNDPNSINWRSPTTMASIRFPRRDVRLLTGPQDFVNVDYSAAAMPEFPARVALRIDRPGRLTGVLWTQELIFGGEAVWTTETYSPLARPLITAGGEEVVLDAGAGWRATNLLSILAVHGGADVTAS
jgi:SAM-dependent methyltransferase